MLHDYMSKMHIQVYINIDYFLLRLYLVTQCVHMCICWLLLYLVQVFLAFYVECVLHVIIHLNSHMHTSSLCSVLQLYCLCKCIFYLY